MAPRNDRYEVPAWRVKSIRDRTEKILSGPYTCPSCQEEKLRIKVDAKTEEASATCNCGFKYILKYVRSYDPVDYYNFLLDRLRQSQ